MKISLALLLALLLTACANQSIEHQAAALNAKAAQEWCNDEMQQLDTMTKQTANDGNVIQSLMTVSCGAINE